MATHIDVYTEGGAPSNGQVASVKVGTVDISKLAQGPTAIADLINMFDLDANYQVLQGGYQVLEAADAGVLLDIGLDGGSTFGAAVDATVLAAAEIGTIPTVGTSGVVTIEVNGAVATKGRVKVWLVVANTDDPAEPVPASVRVPPVTP
jgi:hypothetical protein